MGYSLLDIQLFSTHFLLFSQIFDTYAFRNMSFNACH